MKSKRKVSIGLVVLLVMSLTACGSEGNQSSTSDGLASSETNAEGSMMQSVTESSEVIADSAITDTVAAEEASGTAYSPNQDPANTETTDEILRITLASEPSTLWGPAGGKMENEDCLISYCIYDSLVKDDPVTGEVIPNLV